MNRIPTISVVLSVYNGARFIRDAARSVLRQTFPDFEFILIDDGSTDDTSRILDELNDNRIVRIKNETNIGLVRSLNRGLETAKGRYIARADADDISDLTRFETQVRYLEAHPKVGVLGTAVRQTDVHGHELSVLRPPEDHAAILWELVFGLPFIHPSVMMRRDTLVSVGGYDPAFIHIEDTELWSRLAAKTRFANIPDVLTEKRVHGDSIGSRYAKVQYRSGIVVRKRFFREIIGREISDAIAGWMMQPERALTPSATEDAATVVREFFELLKKIPDTSPAGMDFLRSNVEKKLLQARTAHLHRIRKQLKLFFASVIPVATRHRLKMSRFGKFISRSI